jgi:hypothetical protein
MRNLIGLAIARISAGVASRSGGADFVLGAATV